MRAFAVAALVCLTTFCVGAGAASAAPQGSGGEAGASIINGTPASIAEFPSLAFVLYDGEIEGSGCTGTVVAPRVVLTAGHCVISESGRIHSPKYFAVVTGLADLKQASAETASKVVQVLAAPGFNVSTLKKDAALLILEKPVAVPAMPLATAADAGLVAPGVPMTTAGWGRTDRNSEKSPSVLRKGTTVIQSESYCRKKVERVEQQYDNALQLCAVAAPKFDVSACQGDSGGPGIATRADGVPVQVGIVSFGVNATCDQRDPQVYTRVDAVSTWVGEWANAIERGTPAPAVFIPKPIKLPKLGFNLAEALSYEALVNDFRKRFTQGRFKRIGCKRVNRESVKCRVFWFHNNSVYNGAITTFLSLPVEGSVWNYHYRIRKFNAYCWVYSKNPKECPRKLLYR